MCGLGQIQGGSERLDGHVEDFTSRVPLERFFKADTCLEDLLSRIAMHFNHILLTLLFLGCITDLAPVLLLHLCGKAGV